MLKFTFHGKVVAKNEGQYKLLVFQNLDENDDSFLRYVTTCVCPNWEGYIPTTGDSGFVTCQYVHAGDSFTTSNLTKEYYSYDNCYFLSFEKETIIQDQQKEFKF
jgi:hypothetical protein